MPPSLRMEALAPTGCRLPNKPSPYPSSSPASCVANHVRHTNERGLNRTRTRNQTHTKATHSRGRYRSLIHLYFLLGWTRPFCLNTLHRVYNIGGGAPITSLFPSPSYEWRSFVANLLTIGKDSEDNTRHTPRCVCRSASDGLQERLYIHTSAQQLEHCTYCVHTERQHR